jgi:hypothetical protein
MADRISQIAGAQARNGGKTANPSSITINNPFQYDPSSKKPKISRVQIKTPVSVTHAAKLHPTLLDDIFQPRWGKQAELRRMTGAANITGQQKYFEKLASSVEARQKHLARYGKGVANRPELWTGRLNEALRKIDKASG